MPDWKPLIRRRLERVGLDASREAEVVEELSQHLDDCYQELRAGGASDTDAQRRALEELKDGDLLAKELAKAPRPPAPPPWGVSSERGGYLYGLMYDLRIALRSVRLKPAFSIMVVGMLALGIAGNAAIFSIFNALFLRPLPFPESERLIDLDETAPRWNLEYVGTSNRDFYEWRKNNSTFDGMAFFQTGGASLSDRGSAQRIRSANVTYGLLDVLGLKPVLGRSFLAEEDLPGGRKVVMLGYDLWQRQFQGDTNILGRVLKLDGEPFEVVGILPLEAVIPDQAEIWIPLAADPKDGSGWYLSGLGRLKRGVTAQQALADLTRIHKALIKSGLEVNEITSPILSPLRQRYLGDFRIVSQVLLGAVAVVLLIACVNIAALMMVRASMRAREIAIRTAVGASRSRIIRQLLSESLVLAIAGGLLGVLLGQVFLQAIIALMPPETLPHWITFQLDLRFALFCTVITGAAAMLFGLAPAVQASHVDMRSSMQDAAVRTTLSRGRRTTLSAMVIFEVALALILSVSSALLVQAFRKVLQVDPGFRPENVITFGVSLPATQYKTPQQHYEFFQSLLEHVRAIPGVQAVGATSAPPLGGHSGTFFIAEGDRPLGPNEKQPVVLRVQATPGYFEAIGMRLIAGRVFEERDGESKDAPPVVMVNETFAKAHWGNQNAIGKHVRYPGGEPKWMEVVGVLRDEKHYGLDQAMRPGVFVPFRSAPRDSMNIVVHGSVEPQSLIAPAREALRRMDPDLAMFRVRTMTDQLNNSLWARRIYSWLIAAFAGVALILAAAGIYGVVSYTVTQRTREIGIRMALGAQPEQVLRRILGSGMLIVSIGLAAGLAGAFAVGTLLQTLLFGVSPRDPFIFAAVTLGIVVVGLLANFIPARRAASIDPIRALRFE